MSRSDYDDMSSAREERRGKGSRGLAYAVLICILVVLIVVVVTLIIKPDEKLEVLPPSRPSSSAPVSEEAPPQTVGVALPNVEETASVVDMASDPSEPVLPEITVDTGIENAEPELTEEVLTDSNESEIPLSGEEIPPDSDVGGENLNTTEDVPLSDESLPSMPIEGPEGEEVLPFPETEDVDVNALSEVPIEEELPTVNETSVAEERVQDAQVEEVAVPESEEALPLVSEETPMEVVEEAPLSPVAIEEPPVEEIVALSQDLTVEEPGEEIVVSPSVVEEEEKEEETLLEGMTGMEANSLRKGLESLIGQLGMLILEEPPVEEVPSAIVEEVPPMEEEIPRVESLSLNTESEIVPEETQPLQEIQDAPEALEVAPPEEPLPWYEIFDFSSRYEGSDITLSEEKVTITLPAGSAVLSPVSGIVEETGRVGGRKKIVIALEDSSRITMVGFERVTVKKNSTVKDGDVLGSTGSSAGSRIEISYSL